MSAIRWVGGKVEEKDGFAPNLWGKENVLHRATHTRDSNKVPAVLTEIILTS